jgi:SSXT protein (N-terminal region)
MCLQMLEQNFEYIKAIADRQKRGNTTEANQYSAKLQANLTVLANYAEHNRSMSVAEVSQVSTMPCSLASVMSHYQLSFCLLATRLLRA